MYSTPAALSPGQRVAWYRLRRGMSQEVLAGLVGRTTDWLSKIENDRAALDRLTVIRALADALQVSVLDLIDQSSDEHQKQSDTEVERVRSALLDYRHLSSLLAGTDEAEAPSLSAMRSDVNDVMSAYQASNYSRVLRRLPELLTNAQTASRTYTGEQAAMANTLLALAGQATAMILTKVGESDLAWIAAQRGLEAAEKTGDPVVIGSLFRSAVHSLHSHGQPATAAQMTKRAADYLHDRLDGSDVRLLSVYGTLLLPGAVAAARAGDRATARTYLDEADRAARRLGTDANHVWTAFGPTNVAVHRVVTANALGDVGLALDLGQTIRTTSLPTERRVRHALEMAQLHVKANQRDAALSAVMQAEGISSEQVHRHVIGRQVVLRMLRMKSGKQDQRLADLARRMKVL
ncbi:helix-turn-helix domain-containing protein [Nocardiopsis trehalosi]|uniref:helix-turn-helix domain-containing protein n=1 Tax=Nocardiopsis trehalosi TaxID=109329 RepID=UPI0008352E7D|nr:helix-turn-helix transcriptional regulator [Nocardiopsis trehalosi]